MVINLLIFWMKLRKNQDCDVHSDSPQFYTLDKQLHLCKEAIKFYWSSRIILHKLCGEAVDYLQHPGTGNQAVAHLSQASVAALWATQGSCTTESSSMSSSQVPHPEDWVRPGSKTGA